MSSRAGAGIRLTAILALAIALAPSLAHAQSGQPGSLGAAGPGPGEWTLTAGGGVMLTAPMGLLQTRIGLGHRGYLAGAYYNVGILGHLGELSGGWGTPLGKNGPIVGFDVSTSIGTLRFANDIAGIAFTNFDLGNDWTGGLALLVTWASESAQTAFRATASAGFDVTLAALNFTSFDEAGYETTFEFRGMELALMGEWALAANRSLFLRLDAYTPMSTDIVPLGFLPMLSAGATWGL